VCLSAAPGASFRAHRDSAVYTDASATQQRQRQLGSHGPADGPLSAAARGCESSNDTFDPPKLLRPLARSFASMAYQAATFQPAALLRCRQQAMECRRSATELRAIAKTAAAHKEASCEVAAAAGSAVLMLQQALDAVEAAGPAEYQSSPHHVLRLDRLAAELAAVIDLAEVRVLVRTHGAEEMGPGETGSVSCAVVTAGCYVFDFQKVRSEEAMHFPWYSWRLLTCEQSWNLQESTQASDIASSAPRRLPARSRAGAKSCSGVATATS